MNFLMCSVGRRGELLKDFRKSMSAGSRLIATDNSRYAPALYLADKAYIVPKITDEAYIPTLLDICRTEDIAAIATFIDPEIEILAKNRGIFEEEGIKVLVPCFETAKLCFDKYKMYKHLIAHNIPTIPTYGDMEEFYAAYQKKQIGFPVFVKPRTGSGSVGARKIGTLNELKEAMEEEPFLIIQKCMTGTDLDADVYVDLMSEKVVSIFSKKKLSTTIGGANKTISFRDEKLFESIKKIANSLQLYGPNDMDFFYENGLYYLSEINPRFGGAYLHAYGAGVDFIKLILNNLKGIENASQIGNYEDNVVMMMYDSVVVKRENEIGKFTTVCEMTGK